VLISLFQPKRKESSGTDLVVSFLFRYPELSSLRYNPGTGRLTFRIFLKGVVELTQQQEFRQHVEAYLTACRELDLAFAKTGSIQFEKFDGATALTYEQNIQALNIAEVRLFIELVKEFFAGMFSDDVEWSLNEESAQAHDERIEQLLENQQEIREEKPIIGYRDGGRVFVFPT
jgi:hypothetical protein